MVFLSSLVGAALLIVVATVYIGALFSASVRSPLQEQKDDVNASNSIQQVEISSVEAVTIPITASICLLILFFYFKYAQYFLLSMILIGSTTAVFQLIKMSIWNKISDSNGAINNSENLSSFNINNKSNYNNKCFSGYSEKLSNIISAIMTSIILVEWLRSGNIFLHNILGCSLSVIFVSTLKFPSLKVATMCLCGLLIYDVFWVFFSEYFFSSNVMVTVATQVATNPIHEIGNQYNIKILQSTISTISLPIKLMIPVLIPGTIDKYRFIMLGLGDIALPGALVALALRCDIILKYYYDYQNQINSFNKLESGGSEANKYKETKLFEFCIISYFLSLILAFVCNVLSGHPQPALIYLVPGVCGTFVWRSWVCGVLPAVWAGPTKIEQTS